MRTQNKEIEIKYNKEIFDLDTKLKEQINNNELLINDIEHTKEDILQEKVDELLKENEKMKQKLEEMKKTYGEY